MLADCEVLLVEDNPDDVAVVQRAFRQSQLDHLLAVAHGGGEALEFLLSERSHLPRVILLDLKMPMVDGREVLQRLRGNQRTRQIPIVVVSTSAHSEDIEACYELGANSFVVKQYSSSHPGRYVVEIARYWLNLNRVG